jgi:hypothetical protein
MSEEQEDMPVKLMRVGAEWDELRDRFAMAALTGLLAAGDAHAYNRDEMAAEAWRQADAMLKLPAMSDIKDAEYRALVEAGPAVVMVAKADMLKLLDYVHRYRHQEARRKLTDEQVREIRSSSITGTALASRYGVTNTTIYKIKNGVSYRCVKARGDE